MPEYKCSNGNTVKMDAEDFEIFKMMVESAGADVSLVKSMEVVKELEGMGYKREDAKDIILAARKWLRDNP